MLRTTIDTLRNFWAMENTRGFRRQMYMKRTILEDMSERFVDACEIIIGCDDYVIRNTLMNTLLDFASKYADGMVPKKHSRRNCSVCNADGRRYCINNMGRMILPIFIFSY